MRFYPVLRGSGIFVENKNYPVCNKQEQVNLIYPPRNDGLNPRIPSFNNKRTHGTHYKRQCQ